MTYCYKTDIVLNLTASNTLKDLERPSEPFQPSPLAACQVHEADLAARDRLALQVDALDEAADNEVAAAGLVVHGRAAYVALGQALKTVKNIGNAVNITVKNQHLGTLCEHLSNCPGA